MYFEVYSDIHSLMMATLRGRNM